MPWIDERTWIEPMDDQQRLIDAYEHDMRLLRAENERLRADKAEAYKWLSWIGDKRVQQDPTNTRKMINEAMHYLKGKNSGT